jgi:putative transcriptional regulator
MSPRHHPSEALLVDYAAGALAPGERLAISSHLGACPACAAMVGAAEAVGGMLLSDLPPTAMRADALDLVLARIDRPAPAIGAPALPPPDWIRVPPEILRALDDGGRRSAFGAWVSPVTRGPGRARSYLVGMAPHRGVARHTHGGSEMTCVLKGSFVDDGVVYGPGDFTERDGSVTHAPQAVDEDCVCLLATSAPLAATDWIGRILLPMMGFG